MPGWTGPWRPPRALARILHADVMGTNSSIPSLLETFHLCFRKLESPEQSDTESPRHRADPLPEIQKMRPLAWSLRSRPRPSPRAGPRDLSSQTQAGRVDDSFLKFSASPVQVRREQGPFLPRRGPSARPVPSWHRGWRPRPPLAARWPWPLPPPLAPRGAGR